MEFEQLVKQKKIALVGKELQDGDIGVLADVLEKSEVLKELNLMCNKISLRDDRFTDALARNKTLQVLSLYGNEVGVEGAKRLADVLRVNTTLQQLFLEGNDVGDDGAI